MIVYAQSGMEFHREEKDGRETLHLGQFHIILVRYHFFLILGLYCPQYVIYINIYIIHNMKYSPFFKNWLHNHIKQSDAVKEDHRL